MMDHIGPKPSPTVSAIVPTYNRAAFLGACLESLLAQSYPLAQIIVVNDGSTDHTLDVLESYKDRIEIISKENGGKSHALNCGLDVVTSDFVWVCDDDDIALEDGLARLMRPIQQDPGLGIVLGNFVAFTSENEKSRYTLPVALIRKEEPSLKINFLEKMITHQFASIVRTDIYRAVGGFETSYIRSLDYEMFLRLLRAHHAIMIPDIIYHYRKHTGLRGSAAAPVKHERMLQSWAEYDIQIVSDVIRQYGLTEFSPSFARRFPPQTAQRACLIQRACVQVNHGMWDGAYSDFKEALDVDPSPITPQEKKIIQSISIHEGSLAHNLSGTALGEMTKRLKPSSDGQRNSEIIFNALCLGISRSLLGRGTISIPTLKAIRAQFAFFESIVPAPRIIQLMIWAYFQKNSFGLLRFVSWRVFRHPIWQQ